MRIKYIIHACPERMWYVNEYLIPSMLEQGISREEIDIWNDKGKLGNLKSFIASCNYYSKILNNGGAWHLQDDVILRHDFLEKANKISNNCWLENVIVCGFCGKYEKNYITNKKHPLVNKYVKIDQYMPYSFPCIYIPNSLLGGFEPFIRFFAEVEGKYVNEYKSNRYDDLFFIEYAKQIAKKQGGLFMFIPMPTMVEHIAKFLGGSVVNKGYGARFSINFNDVDSLQAFLHFIEDRSKQDD